ncbi:MAG TPA: protease inhibitor I42 family protein [Dehalococcoidia bacterium]|nr:protease inhibitor I42 family protein [Dehalococcoidia bacterium]
MKLKIIITSILIPTLILLGGCAIASSAAKVEISCDQFQDSHHSRNEIELGVGDTVTIDLCSNPTTGFQWEENPDISDSTILEQASHEFIPAGTDVPGQAGREVWVFKTLKKGVSTVSFKYSRPWEGGEKGEWTYTLTVTVK